VPFNYHINVVKGRKETPHPCDGYAVTTIPPEGYSHDHPEVYGVPKGQKVMIETERPGENGTIIHGTILLPRDGQIAYIMNEKGDTITSYPKKREREMRTLGEEK